MKGGDSKFPTRLCSGGVYYESLGLSVAEIPDLPSDEPMSGDLT